MNKDGHVFGEFCFSKCFFLSVKLAQSAYVHVCVSTQHASSFTAGLPVGMAVSQMAKLLSPKPLRPLGAIQSAATEKNRQLGFVDTSWISLIYPNLRGMKHWKCMVNLGGDETLDMYGSFN